MPAIYSLTTWITKNFCPLYTYSLYLNNKKWTPIFSYYFTDRNWAFRITVQYIWWRSSQTKILNGKLHTNNEKSTTNLDYCRRRKYQSMRIWNFIFQRNQIVSTLSSLHIFVYSRNLRLRTNYWQFYVLFHWNYMYREILVRILLGIFSYHLFTASVQNSVIIYLYRIPWLL